MSTFRRVLCFGLDGATFDLIRPWAAEGRLPAFRRLLEEGAARPLRSTLPPITPTGWTSLLTGVNPGKHGIFGFMEWEPKSYDYRPVSGDLRRAKSVWDYLTERNRPSVVVNVPMYFRPEPIRGDFVAAQAVRHGPLAAHPSSLHRDLQRHLGHRPMRLDRRTEAGGARAAAAMEGRIGEIFDIADYCLNRTPWEFAFVGFEATDRVQHLYWNTTDSSQPDHARARRLVGDVVLRTYQAIDRRLEGLIRAAGPGTLVAVVSDHGAGPAHGTACLNRYLYDRGYFSEMGRRRSLRHVRATRLLLRLIRAFRWFASSRWLGRATPRPLKRTLLDLPRSAPRTFRPETRAFMDDAAGDIRIHRRGDFPQGRVEDADYERIRDELIAALTGLATPDQEGPLFRGVHRREEIYHGPETSRAPDLILEYRDYGWWPLALPPLPGEHDWFKLQTPRQHTGFHRRNGILILHGPGVRSGWEETPAEITDIAPTLLWSLGAPVPEGMDGRVLREAFNEACFAESPVRTADIPWRRGEVPDGLAPEQEAQIRRQLRELGYL